MKSNWLARYFALSYLWIGLGWYFGHKVGQGELWVAILGSILLGAPVLLAGLYGATIRKIHFLSTLDPDSRLHRLLRGRILSSIFWTIWSFLAGFAFIFWFGTLGALDWALVLMSTPVFLIVYQVVYRILGPEYKRYIGVQKSLRAAQWLYALLLALLAICIAVSIANANPQFRLSEVLTELQSKPISHQKSFLLQYAERIAVYYDGAKALAISGLRQTNDTMPLLIAFTGTFVMFLNIGIVLSAFVIPGIEFQRIASRPDDVDIAAPVTASQAVFGSAVTVIVILFIFIPGTALLEGWLKQNPLISQAFSEAEIAAIPHFEQIEDKLYKSGTIASLAEIQAALLSQQQDSLDLLVRYAEIGYHNMVDNIDPYLDWYYSLPAEYLRLGSLLTRQLKGRVERDLQERLTEGDPFGTLEKQMNAFFLENEKIKKAYDDAVANVLRENEVFPNVTKFEIDEYIPAGNVMSPAEHISVIDLRTRVTGIGVGAIGGVIAAKVVGKAVSKGVVKLAATAMAKAAATKATGGAAGAAIGALIGSVIPVGGTLVGAGIGAIVGVTIGVSIDALLLTVEEYLSRDEFRQQIFNSIIEARADLYRDMGVEKPVWKPSH